MGTYFYHLLDSGCHYGVQECFSNGLKAWGKSPIHVIRYTGHLCYTTEFYIILVQSGKRCARSSIHPNPRG